MLVPEHMFCAVEYEFVRSTLCSGRYVDAVVRRYIRSRAGAIGPARQLYCGTAKFLLGQTLSGDSGNPKRSGGGGSNSRCTPRLSLACGMREECRLN